MSAFKKAADRLAAAERAYADAPQDPLVQRAAWDALIAARAAIVAMTPTSNSEARIIFDVLAIDIDDAEPQDFIHGASIEIAVGSLRRFFAQAA